MKEASKVILLNTSVYRPALAALILLAIAPTCLRAAGADKASEIPPNNGSIHGVIRNEAGATDPGIKVAICNPSGADCAYTTSGEAGEYQVKNLTAGTYQISLATTAGPADPVPADPVLRDVAVGSDVAVDLLDNSPSPQATAPATPAATPAAPAQAAPLDMGFFHRFGRAYVADWAGNGPVTAVPQEKRRGTDPPIPSPPYPAGDWPIGGTVVIGAPDGQTYPLMQAINGNKGVNKIYGWVEVGANGSTNNKTNASKGIASNVPAAYDVYSNTVQLDQAAVYFEKLENTAQKSHIDWGYRLALLYGTDYRFTTAHGILSQQLLVKNSQYGFDPVMFYYDLYLPKVGEGTIVRVGRYISLPDIEAQLAPNNYTYSHSILYTYDCYTQLGVNVTTKINKNWTIQGGISASCDTEPWTTDAKATGNVCVVYTWHAGGDTLNTCDNTINDGKYAYNNLTAFYTTWYHRINANWHTDTEVWYQYMKDVPNMYWYDGGFAKTAAHPWPETNGAGVNLNFGAVCEDPKLAAAQQSSNCFAPEIAITNYVEHNFWHNSASLNIRNEYVNDIKGQRTGTPAGYEEHMVGFDFWSGSTVTFRPEVSFTKCYSKYTTLDGKPVSCTNISAGSSIASDVSEWLGNGTLPAGRGKTAVATVAADLIYHF